MWGMRLSLLNYYIVFNNTIMFFIYCLLTGVTPFLFVVFRSFLRLILTRTEAAIAFINLNLIEGRSSLYIPV